MDYETEQELNAILTSLADDFLELSAVLEALNQLNEGNTTVCVVLNITRDLVRKVFNKTNNCKKILELI